MNTDQMIFVFGSNEAGIHGAGAAKFAHLKRGAKMYIGEGPTGKCYALPTKGKKIEEISLGRICAAVERFMVYARQNPEQRFMVTCVGCGLGDHNNEDIAPMFKDAPENCYFDTQWAEIFESMDVSKNYWGTF
jgi:hypothetical protein